MVASLYSMTKSPSTVINHHQDERCHPNTEGIYGELVSRLLEFELSILGWPPLVIAHIKLCSEVDMLMTWKSLQKQR